MKITTFRSQILNVPEDEPLAGALEKEGSTRPIVVLTLGTDNGIEGIGVSFYGGALTKTLKSAIDQMCELCIGEDPLRLEAIISKLEGAAGGSGPGGIFTLALSAIDIALWDIRGKALEQPVWKLIGGARQRIATYASGALRRGLPLDTVVRAAAKLKESGFREMKTQLALPGITSPAIEVDRMKKVREAIGPDVALMCDINQRWRVEQAIDIGKQVEDAGVGLFWLEDVTAHDDYAGIARVNAALSTPICGGELVYGVVPFRHMIEARSVDFVMIDLVRAGGVTPWLKIAGMAEAFNLPVVSHVIPEFHAHLIAGIPNGLTVEYMPWMLKLFEKTPTLDKGELVLSDKPGFDLAFDPAAVRRFAA
ncbi:MAG TPA: mandelate racemase/muconate lactonizing enzyme family protein [Stellaceae bacterium]|jgi:L-alanine-DL-glutamate epimerase-like enolase superfamily enzyme|nr:mandelate racemase/muconate lactonizing enzyme family protein [Stellaceae bacterium]